MLCILTGVGSTKFNKSTNWEYRIEAVDTHLFPDLKAHYITYRRKLIQATMLQRTAFRNLSAYCKSDLLETAELPQ